MRPTVSRRPGRRCSGSASPTGAYYPTGIERADNIDRCAAQD
ncbi:MAG TPA: hypothetical protein VF340_05315 [Methyloceanibacter sp.]